MENASKALIIAAAILIAIILIGIGVFVVNQGVGRAQKYANMDSQDVLAFNSEFESYIGTHVRGSTVKSLVSTINNHNRTTDDASLQVTFTLDGSAVTGTPAIQAGSLYTVTAEYENGLISTIDATME